MTASFRRLYDARVGGVEHSDAAAVELKDHAFFRVYADAAALSGLAHTNIVRFDHGYAAV